MEEIQYTEQEISNAWVQTVRERHALRWEDFLEKLKDNKIKKQKDGGQ